MSNRTQYENDLAALKTALTEMGQSAADAVEAAMEALCTADAEAAAAVAQGDGRINNMERDLEHRCHDPAAPPAARWQATCAASPPP